MGVYFTVSLAKSFSPTTIVYVMAVNIEALSSQLTSLALLLIATEGSIQKELVRSACLVLIGHAIGTIVFIPILDSSINSEMFRQLAKSLPSLYFILLIFFLPESVRWVITQGRLEESSSVLQRSHKVVVEDSLRSKIASVYNDMRKCLSDSNCRGSALKQAVFPIIFARPMWRVFLPAILISILQGSAIGFRLIHDPMPYQSVEDRVVACGVAELVALLILGLLLARLPVRRVLFSISATFAALLLLTRALKLGGYVSCVADLFFSSGGHFITVTSWVWLVLGVIRITPTHSRGTVLSFVVGFGTVGHALSLLVFKSLTISLGWNEYFAALLYSGFVILSGLIVLILPSTPFVVPDMTSHIAPHLYWISEDTASADQNSRVDMDTRL
ncbi:Facilitated trehalose transporter Tret1 [Armadillidium vulgare]|nr:Facilitated trehalose transporter Tret1 [Armadillidium vulgare]